MLLRQFIALLLVGSLASHVSAAIRIVAASGQSAPNTTGKFLHLYHSADGPAPPVINTRIVDVAPCRYEMLGRWNVRTLERSNALTGCQ